VTHAAVTALHATLQSNWNGLMVIECMRIGSARRWLR
jgi:hypothetical protein